MKHKAFTLAEVLITLGIIGVVASMTLPTLVGKYKKVQTISQLKKTYTVLNQAFRHSEADNESSLYWNVDNGIDYYFNTYWKPYLNIISFCKGSRGNKACSYDSSTPWRRANGKKDAYLVLDDASRMPFILSDGTFVSILIASGYGSGEGVENSDGEMEFPGGKDNRIIVDLNASGRPNQFGKDVFLFIRISGKGILPYGYNLEHNEIDDNCSSNGSGFMCAAKLIRDGWNMKDDYPW